MADSGHTEASRRTDVDQVPPAEQEEGQQERTREERSHEVSQQVLEEKDKYAQMSLGVKRSLYECGGDFLGLEDIPTWPDYRFTSQIAHEPRNPPLYQVDLTLNEKVSLLHCDITTLEIDAIVNAAKESLMGGGGVDGQIHSAAGPYLKSECSLLDGCATGSAKITFGYNLPAARVIHAVGPVGEKAELLRDAYQSSLEVLVENDLRSVAFPCISTGIFGYDVTKAAPVALGVIREFLEQHGDKIDRVILCVYQKEDVDVYEDQMRVYFPTASGDQVGPVLDAEGTPLLIPKVELQDVAPTPSKSDQEITLNLPASQPTPTLLALGPFAGHPDRDMREPAIFKGRRETARKELLESYWTKSQKGARTLRMFVESLEESKPSKRTLKGFKCLMFEIIEDLNEIRENLAGQASCLELDNDLSDLTHRAAVAKDQFYSLFPRAYSNAPSSVLSSSMVSLDGPTQQQAIIAAQAVEVRLEAVKETKQLEKEAKREIEKLEEEARVKAEEARQVEREQREKQKEDERETKAQNEKRDKRVKAQKERREEEERREAKAQRERREEEERREAKAQRERREEEEKAQKARKEEDDLRANEKKREREEETERRQQKDKDAQTTLRVRQEEIREELKRQQEETKLRAEMAVAKMVFQELEKSPPMPALPQANRLDDFLEDAAAFHTGAPVSNPAKKLEEAKAPIVGTKEEAETLLGAACASGGASLQAPPKLPPSSGKKNSYQHTLPTLHENADVKSKVNKDPKQILEDQRTRKAPSPSYHHQKTDTMPQPAPTPSQNRRLNFPRGGMMAPKQERPWLREEQEWEEESTMLNPSYLRKARITPPARMTTPATTAPMAEAPCLPKSRGVNRHPSLPRTAPLSEPEPHQRTTFYMPAPQSHLNPEAEPFPYVGRQELPPPVTTQGRDTLQGGVKEEEFKNADRETSALTLGIQAMSRSLAEAISLNRLPVQTPEIFYGNPLQYPTWRASFTLLIERQTISSDEKLMYLQLFLGGAAKDAVRSLFLMSGDEAYYKALSMLEERFGCPIIVARAFRDKLDSWPTVKPRDGEALRTLADFLEQCLIASRVVGQLNILDDAQYQRTLMDKLPEWLQRGWLKRVTSSKKRSGQYPLFGELVEFLTEEADNACEPVFTLNAKTTPTVSSKPPHTPATKKPNYYVTSGPEIPPRTESFRCPHEHVNPTYNTGETKVPCSFCDGTSHNILTCAKFLSLNPTQRIIFLREKNLCFACALDTAHWSKECRQKSRCKECDGPHLTVLHGASFLDFPKRKPRGESPTNPPERSWKGGNMPPNQRVLPA